MQNQSEFDSYSATYEGDVKKAVQFLGASHDFYTRTKAEYLVRAINSTRVPANPVRILDVGCGHGLVHPFLLEIADFPIALTGVDVAMSAVNIARRRNPVVRYDTFDGHRLPYADDAFDVAFAICVLHHVPPAEWEAFIAEMTRIVTPGGVIVIFEHNPLNPLTAKVVRGCPLDRNAVLLRMGSVRRLLTKAGLELNWSRYILFTPFKSRLFRWFDVRMGWLPLGAQYFVCGRKPSARGSP